MFQGRLCTALAMAVTACGCAVGPNYRQPETESPAEWSGLKAAVAATQPTALTTRPADVATWWKSLNDATLDRLIAQAVESNLDLKLATARVRQSRALRDEAVANFWPLVNVGGSYAFNGASLNAAPKPKTPGSVLSRLLPNISANPGVLGGGSAAPSLVVTPQSTTVGGGSGTPSLTVQPGALSVPGGLSAPTIVAGRPGSAAVAQPSRHQNLYKAGFDASWELDIFGGLRRSIEAAEDDLSASEESRRDVLVTLLSEVAVNYVQLRGTQRRLDIAYENIAAQHDTVDLTRSRYAAGFTNQLDVAQAEAQLATTQSQVPLLESSARQSIYQLSVLLGMPPGALVEELEKEAPIPATPPELPLGLPSDLLRRRPDIRTTERQLAAQTARVGVATADLFPKFSLTGSFGPLTADIAHLLDENSLAWSIGPAATWPIFDAGRIRANIEVQNALQEQALLTYEQTVLVAFQDVENALVAYVNEKVRHKSLAEAVDANQRATDLSNELYSRGLTAFLNVLVSQQALYASEDQLVQSESAAVTDLIALYKALGGGWEVPAG